LEIHPAPVVKHPERNDSHSSFEVAVVLSVQTLSLHAPVTVSEVPQHLILFPVKALQIDVVP
jgi:hypothetical protein